MEFEFERRQELFKKFAKDSIKTMLRDFANGRFEKYFDFIQQEEPAHWVFKNPGKSPQLAYERAKATKQLLGSWQVKEWQDEEMETLYLKAQENINTFISELNTGINKLSDRKDVDTTKQFFDEPFLPLPEVSERDKVSGEKENNLPDPHEVAKRFYDKPSNKRKKFKPQKIHPVMKATRKHIINEEIKNIDGHVNSIVDEERFSGTKNTQRKWIKYYAERALKSNEA